MQHETSALVAGEWSADVLRAAELGDVLYVLVLDPELRFAYVSPHVDRLTGYPQQQYYDDPSLLGSMLDDVNHDTFRAVLATPPGRDIDATVRTVTRVGRTCWVHHYARKRRDDDGRQVLYGSARDVTAAHAAVERSVQAEERLRLVVQNTVDVLLRYSVDGVLLWASPSLRSVFGWDPDDVTGTKFRMADPEDHTRHEQLMLRAIAAGQEELPHRTRVRTAAGERRWADTISRLVRTDSGEVDSVVVTVRDVTEQVDTEYALLASEERFRRAMADAAIGMCLVGPDGKMLEVNPALCRFFGRDADDLVSMHWRDLTSPEDFESDYGQLEAVFSGTLDTYQLTKRYLHADGSTRIGDLSVSVIRDAGGGVDYFVSQIVDVTERAAMERALAESEEHFRLLAENASDVVARVADDGTTQWVSQSVTRVLGWTPEEMIGGVMMDLVHPDDIERALAARQQARVTEVARFECRIRTADGSYRWISANARPVLDDNGRPVARIAGWRDIENEMRARQIAEQREAQFQMIAENTADVVMRLDLDSRIEWVSPSVTNVLGWDPKELVGSRKDDLVYPDDVSRVRAEVATLLGSAERGSFDARIRCRDGRYLWFSDMTTLIRDASGQVMTRVAGLRNIDAERRTRQALELSEQRFRLAMESAPGGMALVDLDRKFVQVNPPLEQIVGRDAAWLVGHRVPDLLTEQDQAVDLRMRALVLSGRVSSAVEEHHIQRPDGEWVWVQHSVGLLRDEEGTPLSYISQFLDVTEARQSREDLEFVASHDALTRLANRGALIDQMQRVLAHHRRSGEHLGVLFMDFDGLKPINDRLGHAAGDRVIIDVATVIRDSVRADDFVARFGGDEFVALLPKVASLDDVRAVGDKIRRNVAGATHIAGLGFGVTLSVGAAIADPGDSADHVLSRADHALYQAKAAGGNRVHTADPQIP